MSPALHAFSWAITCLIGLVLMFVLAVADVVDSPWWLWLWWCIGGLIVAVYQTVRDWRRER